MRLPRPLAAAAGFAALAALAAFSAGAAELYGKPLRGLSPVAARDIVQDPARYSGKSVRVEGANAGAAGRPSLKDGEAVLPIVSDGSYKIPADLAGGFLAAEGRASTADSRTVFVATGVEVRREASAR